MNYPFTADQLSKSSVSLGFYSSILTVVVTIGTFIVAFLTPPLSGPLCKAATCYEYPFNDIVSRFPKDYYWMYPAILLSILVIILAVCLHHYAKAEKKIFSQIGVIFTVFGSMILITDLFLQLSVIQPSLLKGEADGILLLTQFNPHGVFIVLEELGYWLISIGFLFMALIFGGNKLEKLARWIFITSFFLTNLTFVWFLVQYGTFREYRFEITAISINWLTLIVSGIILSLLFRKSMNIQREIK